MRIQETDRILKESRYARHTPPEVEEHGVFARAWRAVASLPAKITGVFKKS